MISVEDWSNGAENSTLFQIEYYFTVSVFTVYYIIRDFFQTYVKKNITNHTLFNASVYTSEHFWSLHNSHSSVWFI